MTGFRGLFSRTLAALRAQQGAFERVDVVAPPATADQLAPVKGFLPRLIVLFRQIVEFSAAVDQYVERLRADGKRPIRAD